MSDQNPPPPVNAEPSSRAIRKRLAHLTDHRG
jgi:hypothetical protein